MMKEKGILEKLRDAVVNLDINGVQQACKDALAANIPPYRAVIDGMAKGMEIVGQKYEAKEYFLAPPRFHLAQAFFPCNFLSFANK